MIFSFKEKYVTKELINEKVSDQQIYEFYLKEELRLQRKYSSPYRTDKNPSLSVFESTGGSLLWRDWGDPTMDTASNVVGLVRKIYNDCSYYEALQKIDKDMGLGIEVKTKLKGNDIPPKRHIESNKKEKRIKEIKLLKQSYTPTDIKYWGEYYISPSLLIKYNIYSCKYVWVDGVLVRTYSSNNPTYAYWLSIHDKKDIFKIYSPFAPKGRKWLSNASSDVVQGIAQLQFDDNKLIITKSLKDVIVLRILGYESIALLHEGAKIPYWIESMLKRYYNHIFVLYDNDNTGKIESNRLANRHGYINISVPEYLLEQENVKDISDYVKRFGIKKGKALMSNLIIDELSKTLNDGLPF